VACGIVDISRSVVSVDKASLPMHGLAEMPKPTRYSPNPIRVVDVLTYPAVQLLDVTGPIQVFASANDFVAEAGGALPYVLRVVAQGGQSVTASAGLSLAAGPLSPIGQGLDTLLVAGGEGAEAAAEDVALIDWVRKQAAKARRVRLYRGIPACCGRLAGRATSGDPLEVLRKACRALSCRACRV
jgi:hypothetical protein